MKVFAAFLATVFADNSLVVGVEQQLCGGELCGTAHGRYQGSQVCMRIDQSVIDYFGSGAGEIGEEKCSCIFSHRWHMTKGRSWPVVASKTPECAFAFLNAVKLSADDFNLVDEGLEDVGLGSVVLANSDNTNGRCATATSTINEP